MKKAIDSYDEREQKEVQGALSFPEDELRELMEAHRQIMELLKKHGLTDLTDSDAFYDIFYDEDLRFEFMRLYKQLTAALNVVFPAKEALAYVDDYNADDDSILVYYDSDDLTPELRTSSVDQGLALWADNDLVATFGGISVLDMGRIALVPM